MLPRTLPVRYRLASVPHRRTVQIRGSEIKEAEAGSTGSADCEVRSPGCSLG